MKNDGGPAFPNEAKSYYVPLADGMEKHIPAASGMSLRDWFAGMAICGMIGVSVPKRESMEELTQRFAENAYYFADAMLAEREKDASKST